MVGAGRHPNFQSAWPASKMRGSLLEFDPGPGLAWTIHASPGMDEVERSTTAGQGLFLQSLCIPAIHGGQMQEVGQCLEQLPRMPEPKRTKRGRGRLQPRVLTLLMDNKQPKIRLSDIDTPRGSSLSAPERQFHASSGRQGDCGDRAYARAASRYCNRWGSATGRRHRFRDQHYDPANAFDSAPPTGFVSIAIGPVSPAPQRGGASPPTNEPPARSILLCKAPARAAIARTS